MKEAYYDNYPLWIILVSNFVQFLTYFIGGYIIYQIGKLWLLFYILYILMLEFNLIKGHCPSCYYYGKFCAFGKGKISSLFFKKKDAKKFASCKITWKDLFFDFLVSLIPIITGIILLIIKFNIFILLSIFALFILNSAGNSFVRRNLACKFCRQRKIGCPAEKLFSKMKTQKK